MDIIPELLWIKEYFVDNDELLEQSGTILMNHKVMNSS